MARSKKLVIRDPPPPPVRRSNRRRATTSASRQTQEPQWMDLTTNSPSESPPASPSSPRPSIVTPLIADSSPKVRRAPRRPPSLTAVDSPPSPSLATIDIHSPPLPTLADTTPTTFTAGANPKLGPEVNLNFSPNSLLEGLTTSDSSVEEDDLMAISSPSPTNLNEATVYLLTWYDQPCTHSPEHTVINNSALHTVEENIECETNPPTVKEGSVEFVHFAQTVEDHFEFDIGTHSVGEANTEFPTGEIDLEADLRGRTSIPTKKRKGLGRVFTTKSKPVERQPTRKRANRTPTPLEPPRKSS
ncbi:mucin-2-like [Cynara cardunculus var. scolymus]|uniref:mucin-2-like n=1 Tax=Cynara cardunculus var. scolymus TaxID=59895 RepID=UPI000D6251F8|nr:mucin-2-like [Cynara cardunculus var. scolymus]